MTERERFESWWAELPPQVAYMPSPHDAAWLAWQARAAQEAALVEALRKIAETGDCLCEHDTEDCCANQHPLDFWCPQYVAAKVLAMREKEEK